MATTKIPAEFLSINAIAGTLIADNAITTVHIAQNAITSVQIPNNSIGTVQIALNTVTSTHIAQNQITTIQLANNSVQTLNIADDQVTADKLAASAVVTASIVDLNVTEAKIAANSITATKIPDGSITATQLGANSVTLAKMASLARGSILLGNSAADVSALAIGSNGYVLKSDGTDAAWAAEQGIADNSITSAKIVNGTIVSADIAANTIATSNIADNAIDGTKIASNSILTRHIDDDQVTGDQLADNITLAGTLSVAGNLTQTTGDYLYTGGGNFDIKHNSASQNIVISTTPSGGSATSRVRITHDGKVGIGTDSPSQTLDVNGTLETNNLTVAGAQGSDGQVLTSTGSGVAWEDAAGGGVDGISSAADATAITIDSSERVMIGTTTSAISANAQKLQIANAGATSVYQSSLVLQSQQNDGNANVTRIGFYGGDGSSASRGFSSIEGGKQNSTSGEYGGMISMSTRPHGGTSTERMRIDENGNVLIGTTTFNTGSFGGSARGMNVAGIQPMVLLHDTDDDKDCYIGMAGSLMFINTADAIPIRFGTSDTERMRLDSTGEFLVNRTDGFGTGGAAAMFVTGRSDCGIYLTGSNSSGYTLMSFHNGGLNQIGSIKNSNNNATTFNTSSDYRLKENVDYTWDATTRLKQLKPARFNWISDDTNTLVDGFLAHEVTSIIPEAIDGVKDATKTDTNCILNSEGNLYKAGVTESEWEAGKLEVLYTQDEYDNGGEERGIVVGAVKTPIKFESDTSWTASHTQNVYQSIDHSKLVPLLVKTIQELEARITALES